MPIDRADSAPQPAEPDHGDVAAKAAWRRRMRGQRAAADPDVRRRENDRLAAGWRDGVLTALPADSSVCAYVPAADEPGDLRLLDDALAAGHRVLVPATGEPGPLHWAVYTGADGLRPGRFGLGEPQGRRLAPEELSTAAVVLVPALAVDRRGVRLGRGGGYYDRTLPLARAEARIVCLVRDEEFVDRLPEDPHDVRVTHVLTPGRRLMRTDRL